MDNGIRGDLYFTVFALSVAIISSGDGEKKKLLTVIKK